jgi:ferredoxin
MKARINEDECTGCGECAEAVPDVFEMTEDGDLAKVKCEIIPPDLEEEAEAAADDCPAEAIIIE